MPNRVDDSNQHHHSQSTGSSNDRSSKHSQYIAILKTVLPYIESDEAKIILAQVMVALKVEGVIGVDMTPASKKMLNVISRSILDQPAKKKEALNFARKLLDNEQ